MIIENKKNKSIYIPQIDGKDLWLSNYCKGSDTDCKGYSTCDKEDNINTKRYRATFDYSLDLIKLREIFEHEYGEHISSFIKKKEYSHSIINVTFKYSIKEYNRLSKDIYLKHDYHKDFVQLNDCVCIVDGDLKAAAVDVDFKHQVPEELLGKYFEVHDGQYKIKKNVKTIASVAQIREELYHDGFYCNGIKYVRWKRSSGSARVGKCLFIDERLYEKMREWELCGLDINEGDEVDLAGLESYISLTSSSIIDTIEIKPENILVIDDYDSIFKEDVISVEDVDGELVTKTKRAAISNSIWDGESLIDPSLMGAYSNKGMLLLRNRLFKSCCFNSNIQQWFKDNDITNVSQLNGFTLAKDTSDVKLITTPNSIKYLKFSGLEQWLHTIDSTFGVVKHEKPTHFMDGQLVQTHYQLINTVQLTKEEVKRLLEPTFDFMTLLKNDPAVMRYWIKYHIEDEIEVTAAKSKTDVIYKMLSVNEDFCKTELYYDFKMDFLKSFTKNLKCGHILVNGNYSTICGNPIEMLQSAIGKFNGESCFEKNTVFSTRFKWREKLLASRSPHITMSNVLITENVHNALIEKYMNPTNEIIYINSINENILHRLAGCDMDSDSVLLTNNSILIKAAEKHNDKFKVAVCNVGGSKVKRKYHPKDCADLDIKTSRNLIGDIINLSQELNTLIWDMLAKGKSMEDINDIYLDVCKLSIMSGLEIDKAKKEFAIDNSKELEKLRQKYKVTKGGKGVKPYFFAHLARRKGYYNSDKKNKKTSKTDKKIHKTSKKMYVKFETSMDYLQTAVNSFRASKKGKPHKNEFMKFSEVISQEDFNYDNVNDKVLAEVINKIESMNAQISAIYAEELIDAQEKYFISHDIRQESIEIINNMEFNDDTMIALLKSIEKEENRKYKRLIFYMLFGYPNSSFYKVIKNSQRKIPVLEKKSSGNIEIFGEKFDKI